MPIELALDQCRSSKTLKDFPAVCTSGCMVSCKTSKPLFSLAFYGGFIIQNFITDKFLKERSGLFWSFWLPFQCKCSWAVFYQVSLNKSGPDNCICSVIVGGFFFYEIPTRDSSSFTAWYYTLPVRVLEKKTPSRRIFFPHFLKTKQQGSSVRIIEELDMYKIFVYMFIMYTVQFYTIFGPGMFKLIFCGNL